MELIISVRAYMIGHVFGMMSIVGFILAMYSNGNLLTCVLFHLDHAGNINKFSSSAA